MAASCLSYRYNEASPQTLAQTWLSGYVLVYMKYAPGRADEAARCWMLDARCWIDKKRNSLFQPASRNQHPVSAYCLNHNPIRNLDINVKILSYIDG
ncbi:MAG: hypothetical protein KAU38_10880 [Desulfobacterales bacterium]|nr:hypothetical protein [Desulfobacterales bacterium]